MKIDTLMFKNINSLKGEWRIDFNDPEFTESGIFCISGPTGSGKTTILDAICLALYHRTPRLKTISSSSNELMTRHTAECYSEVTFSSSGKKYRARWEQHCAGRKASGALQNVRVELCEVESGKILASQIRAKQDITAEITGLNFERFTRSVLLAQGSFTAFLKANKKKKAELLEEITGTEIYGDISIRVFERMRVEEQRLRELRIQQKALNILSDEEKKELKKQHKDLAEQKTKEEKQIETLRKNAAWFDKVSDLHKKAADAQSHLSSVLKENELHKADFQRLRQAIPALRLKNFYDPWQKLVLAVTKNSKAFEEVTEEIKKTSLKRAEIKIELAEKKKKLKDFSNQKEKVEKLIREKVIPLDEKIEASKNDLQKLEKKKLRISLGIEDLRENINKTREQLTSINREVQSACQWLDKNKSLESLTKNIPVVEKLYADMRDFKIEKASLLEEVNNKNTSNESQKKKLALLDEKLAVILKEISSLENNIKVEQKQLAKLLNKETVKQWEEKYRTLTVKENTLKQLRDISRRFNSVKTKNEKYTESLKSEKKSLKKVTNEKDKLQRELKDAKEILSKTKELAEKDRLIHDLQILREKLEEGEPCPLCGSQEHPHAHEGVEAGSESDGQIQATEKRVDSLIDELQQKENSLLISNNQIQTFEKLLDQAHKELSEERKIWEKECKGSGIEIELNNPKDIQDYEVSFNESFTKVKVDFEKILQFDENLKRRQAEFADQQSKLKEEQKQKELLAENLKGSLNLIKNTSQNLDQLEARISRIENDTLKYISEEKAEMLKSKETFEQLIDDAKEYLKKQQDLKQSGEKQKILKVELANGEKDIDKEDKTLGEISKEIDMLSNDLTKKQSERKDIFGIKSVKKETADLKEKELNLSKSLEDCRKFYEESEKKSAVLTDRKIKLKQQISEDSIEKDKQEEEFNAHLKSSMFEDIDEFLECLLEQDEIQRLTALEKDINEKITAARTRVKDSEKSLNAELTKPPTKEDEKEVKQRLKDRTLEFEKLLKEYNQIAFKLEEDKKRLKENEKLASEISIQEEIFKVWNRLSSLIGSSDGQSFRNFAQGLTLDHLVSLANVHLGRLHGRYILKRQDITGLDLDVIDTYQADTVRPVDTLSGGESFLVSLALALALSDLASHRISIDSLFLDEGFGTLDAETLDVALDALDNLNASGKMIGVISHIESLKERIPCRIQLSMQGGLGSSRLDGRFAV